MPGKRIWFVAGVLLALGIAGRLAAQSGSSAGVTAGVGAGVRAGAEAGVRAGASVGARVGALFGISPGADAGTEVSRDGTNIDHGQAVQIDLRTTLEKGLRARRPVEFQYIRQISQMVAEGDLPEDLVRSTFGWARNKRPYPFQFFQRALQVRARKLGIQLPTV